MEGRLRGISQIGRRCGPAPNSQQGLALRQVLRVGSGFGGQSAFDTVQSGERFVLWHKPARPQLDPRAFDLLQNIAGLGCPKVRLGLPVVLVNVFADGLL